MSSAAVVVWLMVGALAVVLVARRRRFRRVARAHSAGLAAVAELDSKRFAAEARDVVEVRLELLERSRTAWGWRVWDAAPAYAEQVEGVLVPFGLGEARSRGEAEVAGRLAIAELPRFRLVEVRLRPASSSAVLSWGNEVGGPGVEGKE